MGETGLMWEREVFRRTKKSYVEQSSLVGQTSLIWERAVSFRTKNYFVGLSSLMWERTVSYKREQCHMGQRSILWDMPISCGTDETGLLILKTLLDCQKVQNNFYEDGQVLECLASFKIFFFDF